MPGAYLDLESGYSGVDPIGAVGRYPSLLYFECVTSESHEHSSSITEHPVESGANIADHYRVELDRVSLDLWLTNEPIDYNNPAGIAAQYGGTIQPLDLNSYQMPNVQGAQVPNTFTLNPGTNLARLIGASSQGNPLGVTGQTLQFSQRFNRLADVHKLLEQLRTDAYVFSLITKAAVYPSMAIEKWSMKRDASSGTGAGVTIDFKQLRLVETKNVLVPQPVATYPAGQLPAQKGQQAPKSTADNRSLGAFLSDSASSALGSLGL